MGPSNDSVPSSAAEGDGGSPIVAELLQASLERQTLGERLDDAERRVGTDQLIDVVRHAPILEALLDASLDRREIEERLGVSRATSHRLTRWLDEQGYVRKEDGRFHLTGQGQAVAEEMLRFERNVGAADRLAPLLERICEDHQEFVVEPFADATVTTATPEDPSRPARRFVSLLRDSGTLRGFNTTQMAPFFLTEFHEEVLAGTETELIYLPGTVEALREADPEGAAAAFESRHLTLRTREALPYGLALFDDCVGIGGYDEGTGAMTVFVDTDDTFAREWAERVYGAIRDDSKPLSPSQ